VIVTAQKLSGLTSQVARLARQAVSKRWCASVGLHVTHASSLAPHASSSAAVEHVERDVGADPPGEVALAARDALGQHAVGLAGDQAIAVGLAQPVAGRGVERLGAGVVAAARGEQGEEGGSSGGEERAGHGRMLADNRRRRAPRRTSGCGRSRGRRGDRPRGRCARRLCGGRR
jgi:hypothetical protein